MMVSFLLFSMSKVALLIQYFVITLVFQFLVKTFWLHILMQATLIYIYRYYNNAILIHVFCLSFVFDVINLGIPGASILSALCGFILLDKFYINLTNYIANGLCRVVFFNLVYYFVSMLIN
jgi:hypothetical protein